MENNERKVGIIIATYNRLHMLKELIGSIMDNSYPYYDIIVVNNDSTDGTREWLALQKNIHVINQENCGGAGAFFAGLKFAVEKKSYKYVWIMDDDVEVYKNSLSKLVDRAEFLNDDFGFLCSKVIDLNFTPCNVPGIDMRKNKTGDVSWNVFSEKSLIKVVESSFVSFFLKTEHAKTLGLPYKEFFIWGDDSEYSLRISKLYDSYFVGDSVVLHKRINASVLSIFGEKNKNRMKNFFYFYRNGLFVSRKHKGFLYSCYRYCRVFRDFLVLFLSFKFFKAFIVLKALVVSLFFNPKIEYPTL